MNLEINKETIYPSDHIEIGETLIRRTTINGVYYYCLTDIQKAASVNTGTSRSQLLRSLMDTCSINIRTSHRWRLSRYLTERGVIEMLERSSHKDTALPFLRRFVKEKSNSIYIQPDIENRINIAGVKDVFIALKTYVYDLKPSPEATTIKLFVDNLEKELKNGGVLNWFLFDKRQNKDSD